MIRVYDSVCKSCWFQWKTKTPPKQCPKCKSKNLDIQSELKED